MDEEERYISKDKYLVDSPFKVHIQLDADILLRDGEMERELTVTGGAGAAGERGTGNWGCRSG